MKNKLQLLSVILLFTNNLLLAQQLKPGFDKEEYRQMMLISTRTTADSSYYNDFAAPKEFKMVYQSPVMGLDNLWDLWVNEKNVAVVSIRGTTEKPESWLANFYAAMVPANGELQISEKELFPYKLASDPKAAVHIGWLLSMAYLSKDIVPKIDSLYKAGTKEFLLMGHSQGGAITFLLTAYLKNLQLLGQLPKDIQFKTYCSAGPKPGNLYFAYEYEAMTQGGWAFNVVNKADWVPEMPISIQTLKDFNTVNPFINAKELIKKQKLPARLVMKHIYKKLDKPTRQAQKNYEKYLGEMASKIIKKNISGFSPPLYYSSNHYVRTGTTIVLVPDDDYYKIYPNDPNILFAHHFHPQYLYLLDKLPTTNDTTNLVAVAYSPTHKELRHARSNVKSVMRKRVFIHNQFGFQCPEVKELNQALFNNGFMELDKVYFSRGGGFYTLFPKIRLATLFNISSYNANSTRDNFNNSIRGTTAGSSLGFSIFRNKNVQLVPYAGIVYSWFGVRLSKIENSNTQTFSNYLSSGANQQYIAFEGFMGNLGLHFACTPFINTPFLRNFTVGLRVGQYMQIRNNKWTSNGQTLDNGPKMNTQGIYAQVMFGLVI